MVVSSATIDSLLKEKEQYPPPESFRRQAVVRDPKILTDAEKDPEKFWADQAKELRWSKPWDKVLEWDPPFAKWFVGGTINVSENCLDRHVTSARRNKAAIVWEGESGERRVFTYHHLWREVNKFANVLRSLGVKRGDRVTIYMPMIPELPIAMLACARIGAPHSVIFGGFSSKAVQDRVADASALAGETINAEPFARYYPSIGEYAALLETESVHLRFGADAVEEIAGIAAEVNERMENIGARRLHTVLERLLDEVSFSAPEMHGKEIAIDAAYVRERLTPILKNEDLSRYIL